MIHLEADKDFSVTMHININTVLPHLYPPPIVSQSRLYPSFSAGRISLIVYQYKSTSFVSHSDISLSPKFYDPDFPCPITIYYDHTSFISPFVLHKISSISIYIICVRFVNHLPHFTLSIENHATFNKFRPQIKCKSGHINQAT